MNTETIAHVAPRQSWQQLADEHVALENLELRERNADLEADNDILRDTVREAVAMLAKSNDREHRQRERLERLIEELRELREFVILQDERAA